MKTSALKQTLRLFNFKFLSSVIAVTVLGFAQFVKADDLTKSQKERPIKMSIDIVWDDSILERLPRFISDRLGDVQISSGPELSAYRSRGITHLTIPPNTNAIPVIEKLVKVADSNSEDTRLDPKPSDCLNATDFTKCQWQLRKALRRTSAFSSGDDFLGLVSLHHSEEHINKNPFRANDFFANQLSRYILDPQGFLCSQPSLSVYFQTLNGAVADKIKICEELKAVKLARTNDGKVTLDPDRIFDVQMVKASTGKGMSRWGHIMFRLVICQKGQPVDSSCLANTSEHSLSVF